MDHVVEFPALEQFPQRFEHDPGVVVVVVVVVLGVVVVAGGGVFLLEYLARSHPSPSVTLFRFHGALFAFPIAAFYADDAEEGNPVVVLVDDAFARVEDPDLRFTINLEVLLSPKFSVGTTENGLSKMWGCPRTPRCEKKKATKKEDMKEEGFSSFNKLLSLVL